MQRPQRPEKSAQASETEQSFVTLENQAHQPICPFLVDSYQTVFEQVLNSKCLKIYSVA